MEELRSGAPSSSYRPKNLDALLAASERECEFDPAYKVHPFQLQSIASVCKRIKPVLGGHTVSVECITDGTGTPYGPGAFIVLSVDDSEAGHQDGHMAENVSFDLGMYAMAITLKTQELGLRCKVLDSFRPSIVIAIGHALQ